MGYRPWLVVLAACGGHDAPVRPRPEPAPPVAPVPDPRRVTCEPLPFEVSTPVPEASGAAWMTIDGALSLVVIGDSGNDGAYGIVDPDTGATREQGNLPLGGGGDDLEGVAVRDGKLVAITSAGWIRVWSRDDRARGFTLVDGPYPLGPVDLPAKPHPPPKATGMVCPDVRGNCGRNYEGLCLAPTATSGCLGFAASKEDGALYCVVDEDGKLSIDRARDPDREVRDGRRLRVLRDRRAGGR